MKISRSWFDKVKGTPLPKWYRFAYSEYACALDIYYPLPFNCIARYSRKGYWGFLLCFYWVGLIDTGLGDKFSWSDFYRIKLH